MQWASVLYVQQLIAPSAREVRAVIQGVVSELWCRVHQDDGTQRSPPARQVQAATQLVNAGEQCDGFCDRYSRVLSDNSVPSGWLLMTLESSCFARSRRDVSNAHGVLASGERGGDQRRMSWVLPASVPARASSGSNIGDPTTRAQRRETGRWSKPCALLSHPTILFLGWRNHH